ncbi:MAG: helix-turn-helix domain-containing protein [Candidatus Wallbacteria bacterium]|nr:helix-turn-helix domain-containing protein [Candidatus Wallbacteria bacterium]
MIKKIVNEYLPDTVSHPGATLQDILEEKGLTQAEVAERTGRPKKFINEIIKGKTSISPETAIQFERVLGLPAAFWNQRQKMYDQSAAWLKERQELTKSLAWLDNFPIREMISLKWIKKCPDKVDQLSELLGFFAVSTPAQWAGLWQKPDAIYRMSAKFDTSIYSRSAWLRQGVIESIEVSCREFSKSSFEQALAEIRKLTEHSPDYFESRLVDLCAESGVAVVFVPGLPKLPINGVTRWLTPHKAILQMSLPGKYEDIFWFTFFHEAAHILMHGKRDVFIEYKDKEKDQKEVQADEFAANFLIPKAKWQAFINSGKYNTKIHVKQFAKGLGISPAIIVGRLHHEKLLQQSHMNDLRKKVKFS